MKDIIEKWTASKNTNDFNYNESIKTQTSLNNQKVVSSDLQANLNSMKDVENVKKEFDKSYAILTMMGIVAVDAKDYDKAIEYFNRGLIWN